MSFMNYVKEKTIPSLILLFSIFTIEVFMMLYNFGTFVKIYIPICLFITYFVLLVLEYGKKKRFYNVILKKMEQLDQKYLITEMIGEADFEEARILKDIISDANKSMLEHVNQYKYAEQEYKEYIELWIHEVKTPIATSKMIIENNRNEITQNIEEEIEKIDNYVEQTLFYARSNTLEKDYRIKQINLNEVIHKVMLRNKKALLGKKIQLEIQEIQEKVYSDAKWLEFIINQIVTNSIKYVNQQPKIKISCEKQKNMITLMIEDNGIGIAENEIGKVFEKGFTGENGRKESKATGIGLYLCKKLCKKLGHAIKISSIKRKGTCVKILFPVGTFHNLTIS